MTRNTQDEIKEVIDAHRVILFMKGNRAQPLCGFSARVVEILEACDAEYTTVNVLADGEIRQGIKVFSNWPTIPQLYIKGDFVGGCDIVTDLHLSGQLETLLATSTD